MKHEIIKFCPLQVCDVKHKHVIKHDMDTNMDLDYSRKIGPYNSQFSSSHQIINHCAANETESLSGLVFFFLVSFSLVKYRMYSLFYEYSLEIDKIILIYSQQVLC